MLSENWQEQIKQKTKSISFVDYCKEIETKLENLKTEIRNVDLSKAKNLAEKGRILQLADDMLTEIYSLLFGFRFYSVSVEVEKIVINGYCNIYNRWRKKFLEKKQGNY